MIIDLVTVEYISDLLVYLDNESLKEEIKKTYGSKENINIRVLALASKALVQKSFFYAAWDQMDKSEDENQKNMAKSSAVKSLARLEETVNILKNQDIGTNENYSFALSAIIDAITHINQFLMGN